jgi:hypothetical protein
VLSKDYICEALCEVVRTKVVTIQKGRPCVPSRIQGIYTVTKVLNRRSRRKKWRKEDGEADVLMSS